MARHPDELLYAPLLKGVLRTEAQSSTGQFAGRTTLNSGSATTTVSITTVKSDSIIVAEGEGNANHNVIYGTVSITSGTSFATVSNAAIATDSLVFLTLQAGGTDQGSGFAQPVEVKSLGAGSLDIGWAVQSLNPRAAATTVGYIIAPADGIPAKIEVKTLSEGNFFTLGRADGNAAPRDTTLMWLLLNTS